MKSKPDTLVIGGGGVKGLAALGAVHALARQNHLSSIKTYVGTSAGAMVAAALACGRDPLDIMRVMGPRTFKPDIDVTGFATNFGLDSGRGLTALIDTILDGKHTFGSVLADRGVRLVVCVTNVTQRKPEYLGPDTHPDMDVGLALRMSCAIPLYFAAVRLGDDLYADGVMTDNFPCEYALAHGATHVLGIKFVNTKNTIASLDSYLGALVQSALWRHGPRKAARGVRILDLDAAQTNFNFNVPHAEAMRLFKTGHDQALVWLKKDL